MKRGYVHKSQICFPCDHIGLISINGVVGTETFALAKANMELMNLWANVGTMMSFYPFRREHGCGTISRYGLLGI